METTYTLEEGDCRIIFETNSAEIKEAITAYIEMTINAVKWEKSQRELNIYGRDYESIHYGYTRTAGNADGGKHELVFETNAADWLEDIERYIERYIHSYNYQHMAHDLSMFETV